MPAPTSRKGATGGGRSFLPTLQAWTYRRRGLLGAVILGATMLAASRSPLAFYETRWVRLLGWLGWTCFAVGTGLRFWAILYLGGRKHQVLVEHGPYSVCRNPLYWGSCFVTCSGVILAQSLMMGGGVLMLALVYALGIIPAEERELRAALGQEYLGYCERVPRFLPRPGLFRTPERVEASLHSLRIEVQAALLYTLIPVAGMLVRLLREQP